MLSTTNTSQILSQKIYGSGVPPPTPPPQKKAWVEKARTLTSCVIDTKWSGLLLNDSVTLQLKSILFRTRVASFNPYYHEVIYAELHNHFFCFDDGLLKN